MDSPLVQSALAGNTAPRNGTLYLHDATSPSSTTCGFTAGREQRIYRDAFQRHLFASLLVGTSYSYGYAYSVSDLELITPVVDCSNWMVHLDVRNMGFFYFLSLGYPFEPFHFRRCAFRGSLESNAWALEVLPDADEVEISKNVTTAAFSGFFLGSRTEQAHTHSELPLLEQDARHAATRSVTRSKTILRNSWGWLHLFQLLLALELLLNLVPLVLVSYLNLQAGKLWVGDAFVTISSSVSTHGVVILTSWYASRFWTLRELCAHDAHAVAAVTPLHIYEDLERTDLLGLYLSLCGALGKLTRERVDPLLACLCFHVGFGYRARVVTLFPLAVGRRLGAGPLEGQQDVSPMQFWTSHELERSPRTLYAVVLGPESAALMFVALQIPAFKRLRRLRPAPVRVLQRTTDKSSERAGPGGEAAALLFKRVLTLFEIATGAELESRFGLLSEYDNYVFFKGVKFASADGVYSNGFVIVGGKFVIPTRAYFKILLMTLLRKRFATFYLYELDGTTVQQTARLVYPDTMSLTDLGRLHISILS